VQFTYSSNPDQNITIVVGLPLNSTDGGSGGVEGSWNGRTQGLGGGGCNGNTSVTRATNARYVGSGTDGGHSNPSICSEGVNPDGSYNMQWIQDFFRNGIKQQIIWSKQLTSTYYEMKPDYNYWDGCSTGGRQGYLLAQELPGELDGILANAPAMHWTRFATAQIWGQVVMKDLLGGPIAPAKLAQARASAIAACDANDGVTDGIIDDPRTCKFSAKANICGTATAPASNCLTAREAEAVDLMWDGPRNRKGHKIWFHIDRGTDFSGWDGPSPFPLTPPLLTWNEQDPNFDWHTIKMNTYPKIAQDGSVNIADVTDTFGNLDSFIAGGGKMITVVGMNDQLIMPLGVINYYRKMAARYDRARPHRPGDVGPPDFSDLQKNFRLFRAPGMGHCGGGLGPSPTNAFQALVNWVEQGTPPQSLLASGGTAAPPSGRTRPLCPYPQTAIYKGSGSINEAVNWECGGNVDVPANICFGVLAKYKHEVNGPLDYAEAGTNAATCRRPEAWQALWANNRRAQRK
jgi:hypothetical protein